MNFTKIVTFSLLLVLLTIFTGCFSANGGLKYENPSAWRPEVPDVIVSNNTNGTSARTIRPEDRMLITIIPGTLQPTTIEDIVDANGMITLPLVGEFLVGGYTTSEIEKKVRDAYVNGGLYKDVSATVVCRNASQERVVYVSGAVHKKGAIPFTDGMTLRMAIVTAGDRTTYASSSVRITRDGKISKHNINRIEKNKEIDPVLRPNDMIEVEERWL